VTPIDRLAGIERKRLALLAAVASLGDAALTTRPEVGKWSIREIIEHLVLAEDDVIGDFSTLDTRNARARRIGNHAHYLIVMFILRFRIPVKAPSRAMVPTGERPLEELRATWDEHHRRLRTFVAAWTRPASSAPSSGIPSRARSAWRRASRCWTPISIRTSTRFTATCSYCGRRTPADPGRKNATQSHRVIYAMNTSTRAPSNTRISLVGLVFAAMLATGAVRGDEAGWPQFRGPDSNPVSTNARLAETWGKTENVEWSVEIPGRGWSSPIVTGEKVFVTSAITEGPSKPPQIGTEYSNEYVAELTKQGLSQAQVLEKVTARDIELPSEVILHYVLSCRNLNTGKLEWQREFYTGRPPGGRHRKNSFVSETPVTDGRSVYVYVANLGLYAFNLKGKPLWSTPQEALPMYLDFGTGSSPVLAGGLLVIVNDNEKQPFIGAYDTKTGKEAWRQNRDVGTKGQPAPRSAWVTPYVWRHSGRTEIVTVGPGLAISYDVAGKELWRMSGMSGAPIPMPFACDGLLYVNAGRGRPLFAIRPGAAGDISLKPGERSNQHVAWSEPRGGTYLPTAVGYQGALYSVSETGILSRYDAKTGNVTYKTRIDPAATAFSASPWAYNGKVFFLSEEGQTFVVPAGETFRLLRVNALDDMALASPAIAGDRLLVRTEHRLYSIRRPRSG
jgi:outer membrane protein assembly factor BamB